MKRLPPLHFPILIQNWECLQDRYKGFASLQEGFDYRDKGWRFTGNDGSWNKAQSREQLIEAIHSNLKNLGLEGMDIVNLCVGEPLMREDEPILEQFNVLVELQKKGLIKHLGLSTSTHKQFEECRKIAPVVCIQNMYNVVTRKDDAFIDELSREGIAYVPYFPLGGFTPLQSGVLDRIAGELGCTSKQVALAWLLQRSPNILLIPGTSSIKHLVENMKVGEIKLSQQQVKDLQDI